MGSNAHKLNFSVKVLLILIVGLTISNIVYSHGTAENKDEDGLSDKFLKFTPTNSIIIASVIAIILVLFSLYIKKKSEKLKWLLFLGIIIPIIIATFYLAASTIYLNVISETKGPVHWHTDYEIWKCGKKIDLVKPKGLANRIGNPLFHDHGDNRIHIEGVVTDKTNVDLYSFFEVIGGLLTSNSIAVPTDYGIEEMKNGDLCDGNQGTLQVFLYRIKNPDEVKSWVFELEKLEDFEEYVPSPHSQIPPGDCIIIEFGEYKERTDRICETYNVAIQRGELGEII